MLDIDDMYDKAKSTVIAIMGETVDSSAYSNFQL